MRNKFLSIVAIIALGTFASAQVLDHITGLLGTYESGMSAAQDFGAANDGLDIQLLEDMTVNANELLVTKIEAVIGGFNVFQNVFFTDGTVTAYNVNIYDSVHAFSTLNAGNVAAATFAFNDPAVTVSNALAGFTFQDSLISIDVSMSLPAAGQYWVSIQPVMTLSGNGQTGIMRIISGVMNGGDNAYGANPNGGFGYGRSWNIGLDVPYRVTAVPEPASMIALGLGLAALVARRRRKKAA